ncbi:MAG: alpha-hydroxy-acid oxidizing protein, partial [Thermoleophilaceae bacterium]
MTLVARKADHLRIAAGTDVAHVGGTGLQRYRLRHRALPERDLADISLETELLGAHLGAPLIISAMTGGTPEAEAVNARLARAASVHRLALVLGSGRALLDDPALLATYRCT